MSEFPGDANDANAKEVKGPLDPETEQLFGFETDAWAARLKSSHEAPGLGRFGPYELLGEVGRGGQGEVYRAVQPGTGRIVALKRVAGLGFAPDASLLARFAREVEALTRLSHPNVVIVHTLDVIDGHTVLVMEFVDGRHIDLWADEQWLREATPLKSVLETFVLACDGVAHAHQRGVIHRDLKPSNILVTAAAQPKVLDFGIARLLGEQAAAGARAEWSVTGFAGTPAYASPEQLAPAQSGKAGGIDTRSDVYSLGVLLFRMLTGVEAFDPRDGIAARLQSADDGPVRAPSRIRAAVPTECDWIVRKATEPDAARRYPTVDAFAEDVRRLLDSRPVMAHPPSMAYTVSRAVRRRPFTSAGIAFAVIAVTSLGVVAGVQAARLSARSKALTEALVEANAQRSKAEQEEQRQRRLTDQMLEAVTGTVASPGFWTPSADSNSVRVLHSLVQKLTPQDSDETRVALHLYLGYALRGSGRHAEALEQLNLAAAISERVDDPTSERAARIVIQRSIALRALKRNDEALTLIDKAMERAAARARNEFYVSLQWERLNILNALVRPTAEILEVASAAIAEADQLTTVHDRTRLREDAAAMASRRGAHEQALIWAREGVSLLADSPGWLRSRLEYQAAFELAILGKWGEAETFAKAATDYRLSRDDANSRRTHSHLVLHANILQRLGRFDSAKSRWELASIYPMSMIEARESSLVSIRTGLAAASFALGEEESGRALLTMAVTRNAADRADNEDIRLLVERAENALRNNTWIIDDKLRNDLGDLAWLVEGLVLGAANTDNRSSDPE